MSVGASGHQLATNIAQQAGVHQTTTPKQVRAKDADETRRTEQKDDEEHSSRPGGAKEKASAETAAAFSAGDGAKVKKRKNKNRQVSVGGASGSKSSRRASQTSQNNNSQQNQGADKTDGASSRYRNSGRYSDERSHQISSKAADSLSRNNQASVKFEQAQRAAGNDANPLSAAGQRRAMLENLSRMVRIGLEQHTGGTAGEAYPRRETRQIYSALQGLKAGGQPTASNENRRSDSRNVTTGEFKLKEQRMNNVLAIFLDPPAPPEGHEPLELVA